MLDVGCADGTFLNEMRNLGWETTGLEMDARTAERARSTRGLEIVTGVVDAVEFPAGSFDLITLSHVLEHLPHPRQALQRVRGWLKEGGLLFLTLPNSDCWERRSFGQYWIQWDLPRHFYHFTPETLGRLLREEGFPIVNTHYLSGMYVLQSLRCRNLGGAPCPPAPGAPAGAPRELLKTLIWRLRLFIGSLLGGLVRGELQEVLARKS